MGFYTWGNITMYRQDFVFNKKKYTIEELLSIFKAEAQSICNEPKNVSTIAESALKDFIKSYGEYVKSV
ncbi:MAG: hypothetical protein ACE5H1_01315 [Thermodesulfobacteriota bacterium]